MRRVAIESSNLVSIGWEDGTLEVEFKRGEIYQYENVPHGVYEEILFAPSAGKALMARVVGKYPETKL